MSMYASRKRYSKKETTMHANVCNAETAGQSEKKKKKKSKTFIAKETRYSTRTLLLQIQEKSIAALSTKYEN